MLTSSSLGNERFVTFLMLKTCSSWYIKVSLWAPGVSVIWFHKAKTLWLILKAEAGKQLRPAAIHFICRELQRMGRTAAQVKQKFHLSIGSSCWACGICQSIRKVDGMQGKSFYRKTQSLLMQLWVFYSCRYQQLEFCQMSHWIFTATSGNIQSWSREGKVYMSMDALLHSMSMLIASCCSPINLCASCRINKLEGQWKPYSRNCGAASYWQPTHLVSLLQACGLVSPAEHRAAWRGWLSASACLCLYWHHNVSVHSCSLF